jgi:hypothetical protein
MGCRGTDRALVLLKAGRREFTDAATFGASGTVISARHRSTPSRIAAMTSLAELRAAVSHSTSALLDEN